MTILIVRILIYVSQRLLYILFNIFILNFITKSSMPWDLVVQILDIYILISSNVCIIYPSLMFCHNSFKLFLQSLFVHLLFKSLSVFFLLFLCLFPLILSLHLFSQSIGSHNLAKVLIFSNISLLQCILHSNLLV